MADTFSSGINTSYADTYDAKATELSNRLNKSDLSKASDDELMKVCKDFESYFLEQVLKSMEKMATVNGDEEKSSSLFRSMAGITGESDAGMNTLGNYFGDEMVKTYATVITNSGNGSGLGIAQSLYEQMKRNYSGVTVIPEAPKTPQEPTKDVVEAVASTAMTEE